MVLDTQRVGGDDAAGTLSPQRLGDRLAIAVDARCDRIGMHDAACRAAIGFFSPFLDRR
ncbi:hypothetical protein [Xanthomonas tesorieronis]|uniref:hypothetical protein n=1 Tax=Xanthomonas tesorieronis TaxID=3160839 RepID=UPI003516CFDA